jgi:hypothetical protein
MPEIRSGKARIIFAPRLLSGKRRKSLRMREATEWVV